MELTLLDYLSLLRKYWRSIAAITLVAISLAATYCLLVQPTYTSKASLFFSVNSANSASDLNAGSSYAESQVQSFAKVARTDIVLQPVIDKLGLATTPEQLAKQVTVTVPTKTATLDLAAVSNSPDSAAQLAHAISEQLVTTTIDQLSPPGPDGTKSVTATIISSAELPVVPTILRVGCERSLEESPDDRPYLRSDTVTITGSYTTLLDSTDSGGEHPRGPSMRAFALGIYRPPRIVRTLVTLRGGLPVAHDAPGRPGKAPSPLACSGRVSNSTAP